MAASFRSPRPRDIRHIAQAMRDQDRIECAAFGYTPEAALRISLAGSTHAETAVIDGRPAAILGVTPADLLTGEGAPWMLGTDAVMHERRVWLAHAQDVVPLWLEAYQILRNWVARENIASRVWLRRLGFQEDGETTLRGVPMVSFYRTR